jgi:single-strand DNA-binding protein
MNSVNIIGRITAQPEIRYTSNGKGVANATLAVDDGYGEKKKTLFLALTFWSPQAETAHQHLVKGQRIGVSGRLSQEEFTPQGADKPIRKTHITVVTFDFLDKPAGAPPAHCHDAPSQRSANPEPPADEPDDVPF